MERGTRLHGEGGGPPSRLPEQAQIGEHSPLPVTPESLFTDNNSQLSQELIASYQDRRDVGELYAEDPCSDSRPPEPRPDQIVRNPSIAASGPIEPFIGLYQDHRIKAVITKAHYSQLQSRRGQRPRGCGGGDGKAVQEALSEMPIDEGDIDQFIRKNVWHSDVVVNSLIRAASIAQHVDKPVLATAIAHDSLDNPLSLLGWFRKHPSGSIESRTAIPLNFLLTGNYKPSEIYAHGIPTLDRGELPDEFQERIDAYEKYIAELQLAYPNYAQRQSVQNPTVFGISPNMKSASLRYPHTFGAPGTIFEARVARKRIDDETVDIDPESLYQALNQAHFPIAKSIANHENDTKEFARLNRILIETPSLDLSLDLAVELSHKPWMKEWMELPNHRIMLARTRAGKTEAIQYLT